MGDEVVEEVRIALAVELEDVEFGGGVLFADGGGEHFREHLGGGGIERENPEGEGFRFVVPVDRTVAVEAEKGALDFQFRTAGTGHSRLEVGEEDLKLLVEREDGEGDVFGGRGGGLVGVDELEEDLAGEGGAFGQGGFSGLDEKLQAVVGIRFRLVCGRRGGVSWRRVGKRPGDEPMDAGADGLAGLGGGCDAAPAGLLEGGAEELPEVIEEREAVIDGCAFGEALIEEEEDEGRVLQLCRVQRGDAFSGGGFDGGIRALDLIEGDQEIVD